MKETKYLIFLLLPLIFAAGCIRGQMAVTLNPNGSGKIVFESVLEPCAIEQGQQIGSAQQIYLQFLGQIKNTLLKSEGIDAWSDVDWRILTNGKFFFKAQAYFKSIDEVTIYLGNLRVNLNAVYQQDVNNLNNLELKSFKPQTSQETSVQRQNSALRYQLFSKDMKKMLDELKIDLIFSLPADVNDEGGFEKIDGCIVRYSVDGNRMKYLLDYIQEQQLYDLAEKSNFNRYEFLDNVLLPLQLEHWKNLKVHFAKSGKNLFDYEKEKLNAQQKFNVIWERLETEEKTIQAQLQLSEKQPQTAEKDTVEYNLDINSRLRNGLMLETKGNYEQALRIYSKIIADKQTSPKYLAHAYYRMGMCLFEIGDSDKAIKQFDYVLANFPSQRIAAMRSLKMIQDIRSGTAKRKAETKPQLPTIIETSPENYVNDVNFTTDRIIINFSEPMDTSNWFYSSFAPGILPLVTGMPSFDSSGKIWALPVNLDSYQVYAIAFNCGDAVKDIYNLKVGFRNIDGKICKPFILVFATTGEDNMPTEIGEDLIIESDEINTNSDK